MPYQPVAQPVARLLAALELLQTHRRVTGGELAERLQVDRRSARRYVARLIEMGVPIDTDRGRDGAYRLTAGYKLPPMMFSDDEALALALGLVAARDLGLGEARLAVHSALDKLERVMPENLRLRVRSVARAVRLDLRGSATPSHARALATLSEAIQKQQRVRLRYLAPEREPANASGAKAGGDDTGAGRDAACERPGSRATERLFDAWGLAYYNGHWYAVGHCHLRGGQRSFRVDRIEQVQLVAASFAPPPDFDALAAMRHTMATLPRQHPVEVLLHTTLDDARHELPEDIGTFERVPVRGAARVRLVGRTDDLAWFARQLARVPFRVEIRKPAALADALRSHAEKLLGARAPR
jgi:predicted DNA-binding transcriptional regulator YafY